MRLMRWGFVKDLLSSIDVTQLIPLRHAGGVPGQSDSHYPGLDPASNGISNYSAIKRAKSLFQNVR